MLHVVSLIASLSIVIASVFLIVAMLKGSAVAIVDALLAVESINVASPRTRMARRIDRSVSDRRVALRAAA